MINNLPTIFEVLNVSSKKLSKERTPNSFSRSNKPRLKTNSKSPPRKCLESGDEEEEEEGGEHENTLCGACGKNYASNEFWICCDVCERWFHGKCVKVTPAMAEHIKQYKCPDCSNKRAKG